LRGSSADLIAGIHGARAPGSVAATAGAARARPRDLAGRVVEAGTTRGVPDAVVRLSGPSLGSPGTVFANGTTGGARSAVADGSGRFVFRDMPAGPYLLLARGIGLSSRRMRRNASVAIAVAPRGATLDIGDADRPLNVTIQCGGPPASAESCDESGDPIVGVSVAVIGRSTDWTGVTRARPESHDRRSRDVSRGRGARRYQIAFLGALTTVPAAAVDGFQRRGSRAVRDVELHGQVERMGCARQLRFAHRRVHRQSPRRFQSSLPPFTDRTGRWMFYPTTYAPGIISVTSGEERTSVNLDLRAIPIRRVTGHVAAADGGAAAGLAVRLVATDPAVRQTLDMNLEVHRSLTDGAGNFTFFGVAPGTYALYAFRRTNDTPRQLQWASSPTSVADADVSGIDLDCNPGKPISGRLPWRARTCRRLSSCAQSSSNPEHCRDRSAR
jgi:hypothetical protein